MKIEIIIGGIVFILLSVFLYFYNIKIIKVSAKNKKKKEKKELLEIKYLMIAYNLKKEKLLNKKIVLTISIIDAFIIASVFTIVELLPWDIMWKLMLGFVLLLGLIYAIYGILGRILVKKGYDK